MNGHRTASPQHPHREQVARNAVVRGTVLAVACTLGAFGLAACSSGKAKGTQPAGTSASATGSAATNPLPTGSGAANSATTASASSASSPAANPSSSANPSRSASSRPPGPAGGPVPRGFVPYSSTWVSASDGWVLGTAPCSHAPCGSVLRTVDGGHSWKGVAAPKASVDLQATLPSGGVDILRFADRTDGWAAGRGLYATHDGGTSWHRVAVGPSTGTVQALETGGGYVYALIQGCPPSGEGSCAKTRVVYAARAGSDSWTVVSPALGDRYGLLAVHGASWYLPTGSGILTGTGTSRLVTRANPCPSGPDGDLAAGLIATADSVHFDALCTSNGTAGGTEIQLYGSTDAARHWTKAGGVHRMVPDQLTGMADNGHGVLLISTASGGSYILRSTDDGRTLHHAIVSAPTGGFPWADLGFTTSAQVSVTLPGHGLYLSRDTGRSFARVSF